MLGTPIWYHGSVRKYVALFGTIFNDISIERVDTNGNDVKVVKVPIAYGPKERYLTRQDQNPDLLRPINQVWPRMAYEIVDFRYDSDRKLNSLGKNVTGSPTDPNKVQYQLNPVPYNLMFRLSILCRNTEDALRVVEQILPFFTPALNVSANLIPEMNYGNITIPIILNSVTQEEQYEGSFEDKEYVIWTLDFTMKASLYGPTSSAGVIKEITINFEIPYGNTVQANPNNTAVAEHLYIRPGLTANGQPTTDANTSIPIANIDSTSNYGIITQIISDANG